MTSFQIRAKYALRAAVAHLMLSMLVAGASAVLVFYIWFPGPLRQLTGGMDLFLLIVSADVVCGPLLTLIVFDRKKSRKELGRDLFFVAIIQCAALGYGLHTLSYARPVAVVHEVDRFRIVSFADLDAAQAAKAPAWARPWSVSSPQTMGLRPAANLEEKMESVEASLNGVEPSQRPDWWQDYQESIPLVLQRSHPLSDLLAKHPEKSQILDSALSDAVANHSEGETMDPSSLRWLPVVSRHATDWVVFLDPVTARIRGFVHLDGF